MRFRLGVVTLATLVVGGFGAPGSARSGLCDAIAGRAGAGAYIAVFSAFPREVAPLVARTTVREEVQVNGRNFRVGELGGMRVVLGLTGIGMLNAAATSAAVFERFDVAGAVFSGVAGGPRIGDVTVPAQWRVQDTGAVFDVNRALFALARQAAGRVDLGQCTVRPSTGETICVEHRPRVVLGGLGVSGDPFGGMALECDPGGGEVFGCDVEPAAKSQDPIAEDMETAAVAQVASERQIPFVGFRGASDGAGDPLGLPGFPAQFFAWYRLAADNAAAPTVATLERLARLGDGRRGHERVCRLLDDGRWKQAVRRLRASRAGGGRAY